MFSVVPIQICDFQKKNSPVQLEKWMYLHMIIDMAKTGKSRGLSQTEMLPKTHLRKRFYRGVKSKNPQHTT